MPSGAERILDEKGGTITKEGGTITKGEGTITKGEGTITKEGGAITREGESFASTAIVSGRSDTTNKSKVSQNSKRKYTHFFGFFVSSSNSNLVVVSLDCSFHLSMLLQLLTLNSAYLCFHLCFFMFGFFLFCVVVIVLFISVPSSSSSLKKKRKSLPTPVSGNGWTVNTLKELNIKIEPASLEEVLNIYQEKHKEQQPPNLPSHNTKPLFPLSNYAKSVLQQCEFLDQAMCGFVLPWDDVEAILPSAGVGRTLFKYLRLLHAPYPYNVLLESVVDDFVVHLLVALGFNEGPLLILSKNQLSFTMNRNSSVKATADVTVYHIGNRFRVAVFEDKRIYSPAASDKDTEAQLVAEALAAVQANMERDHDEAAKSKRSRSQGDASSSSFSPSSIPFDDSGRIFMIRVLGSAFSFYSCNFKSEVIEVVKDYSQLSEDKEMQQTIVYKLTFKKHKASTVSTTEIELGTPAEVDRMPVATTDSVPVTSAVLSSLDELQFLAKPHRELIVTCLDSMRQIILQSDKSSFSASGSSSSKKSEKNP